MSFPALVVDKADDTVTLEVRDFAEDDLLPGEVTIRVEWSGLNYKDGLACRGDRAVAGRFPLIPGIDLAGTVEASTDPQFSAGQKVVAIGYDIGTNHHGGYAAIARIPSKWVVALPGGLSAKEAMAIGTAGFTAAMSVEALQKHGVTPDSGPVLVTGATGGVGSVAVTLLAQLGYTVAASTGKESEHDFLRGLGATEILSREEVSAESKRPMESARWAGAVDPVGGATTAYLVRTTKPYGSVAVSGLTGGGMLNTTVFPFILRGVNLLGIESVSWPIEERRRLWARLASDLKPRGLLDLVSAEVGLDTVPSVAAHILKGQIKGRVLVNPAA